MIKRTDSESNTRRKMSAERKKQDRQRRRQLTIQSLEDRQMLDASSLIDPTIFDARIPRNIGTVPAAVFLDNEAAGVRGVNDTFQTAQLLPLGTGANQEDTIDLTGSMGLVVGANFNIQTDIDVYAFDLRAGDILDLAVLGSGANLTVMYENGGIWFGTDVNTALVDPTDPTMGTFYGNGSPLQTLGNAVGAQVVPEDGRYYLYLAPSTTTSNYTVGLRAYRPISEQLPIGVQQIVYLDFDGGVYPTSIFNPGVLPAGVVRFSSLNENLAALGFVNPTPDVPNGFIDFMLAEIEQQMQSIADNGTNGDYDATGIPGQYGVTILNSRDHADPGFNNPIVTRVFMGLDSEIGTGAFGISQSIDVGNFNMNEVVLAVIEPHTTTGNAYPISPSATVQDSIAQQYAGTITHELAHSFGIWHTDGNNLTDNLIDEGSQRLVDYSQGVGPDGIFGSSDDIVPMFVDDRFSPTEGSFFGVERVPAALSHVLSTGRVGTSIGGRVFNDINRDGNRAFNDPGLAGVTVFADANNNGIQDPTDPTDVTAADGSFSLAVATGAVNVYAVTPAQFIASTPVVRDAAADADGVIEFGFTQVIADATGTKFADNNGNGLFDANETGIGGVYIYLDLDNDNRPDLGEPSSITAADGTYSLNFPGPGTYTIREVVTAGFIQTFPNAAAGFEHVVTYNGIALTDNYNFGNLPSRDWGDAPESYLTLAADGGPSHGITPGLGLGANIDREVNGQPTVNADGDDATGTADEDGVRQLSPLGPGDDATFEFTTRNDSGVGAYLQGWFDFNGDGDFSDPGERVFTNRLLGTGTQSLTVSVPEDAVVGTTYARFRYSTSQNLGIGGDADDGEVEDYVYTIQNAAELINDDFFTVSRNTQSNQFFVLANDFETPQNQLTIAQLGLEGTDGQVSIAGDGRSVLYTPRNNFVGRDAFLYTVRDGSGNIVRDEFNNPVTATVVVNVTFQSAIPIALDDTFEIPQGSSNRALNVLDNDVPSVAGGIRITSVSGGNQGGRVTIDGGGQTLRYTPAPGFTGTEQFMYNISDELGQNSMATVTVNMLPGSRDDDMVEFSIGIFDTLNNQPITNVQVGQKFNVRVFVDDLRYDEDNPPPFNSPEGVASAFLDLLYTDELVATMDTDNNPDFPFDITFGELFENSGFSGGSSAIPGILDEVGAVQPISVGNQLTNHSGPTELFTVTMEAVSPGVAVFTGDPADNITSETILLGQNVALTPQFLRLGRTELTITPESDNFTAAIDDSFPTGVDSNGNPILDFNNDPAILDVLANDNLGSTGIIREFGLATAPTLGTVDINDNGSPLNFNDDFIEYTPFIGTQGFERFSYVIVTDDGVRSTAEVTMQIGADAGDVDLVALDFEVVDGNNNPIALTGGAYSVTSGSRFGVQIYAEDLRTVSQEYVFAAFLDVLYDSDVILPSDIDSDARYDFDVIFGSTFDRSSGVGTAGRLGIIDEFGSQLSDPETVAPVRNLLATLYFDASAVAQVTTTQVVGGPADAFPFQDTLLSGRDEPVEVEDIRYDLINIRLVPSTAPLTNRALPPDVNGDGNVTPLDALTVVNQLAAPSFEGESAPIAVMYTDVNGDNRTSALDALQVINYLREQRKQALLAGELVTTSNPVESETAEVDGVFADLSRTSPLVSVDGPANRATAGVTLAALEQSTEDDDDDLLSLLADDQLTQRF
ncbi:Ig-like domain-containing protein [Stieleria varia]|uniref:Dockerin type I repeat protein n=1 Tax=Stieleria varia TaxID=2528005 RepID=A0A5C6AYC7_9BACT|nr:Ig-like domain-containing protein [Stieleria varia]TWU04658.1 Dockerin type I repeat protein [Stieleria varia]